MYAGFFLLNLLLLLLNLFSFSKKKVKIGYPPRVCKAKDEDTLASAGLQNGDIIILTELSLAEVVNMQPAPAHANIPTSIAPTTTSKSGSKDVISVPTENGFVVLRV